MPGPVETELKLTVRPEDLDALRTWSDADGIEIADAARGIVVSTYFDTDDRRLRARGLSLRQREVDGRTEQTLKSGGGLVRGEITVDRPSGPPALDAFADHPAGRNALKAVGRRALLPAFTMRIDRAARVARMPDGSVVDVAVDAGEIIAGRDRGPLAELELELRRGRPEALYALARAMLADRSARPSTLSKAERGHRLTAGEAGAPAPVAAVEADLSGDARVADAAGAVFRSCLAQILANVDAVEASDDSEGPHQLRIGLRRLRTALRVFGDVVEPAVRERLKSEARDLARAVGALRDLDVLAEDIVGVCSGHVDTAALAALLAARRIDARSELLRELAAPRTGALLLDLHALSEGLYFDRSDRRAVRRLGSPADRYARDAVHRLWSKTARLGRLVDDLTDEDRHELRKSFKTLRYALDSLGSLIGRKDLRHLRRDVRAAQDVLGYLNDVRNADSLVAMTGDAAEEDGKPPRPDLHRAVGFCLGWHRAEAVRVWSEGKDLVRLDPTAY
jgi:inorganic triphosphatase YgiF